MNSKYLNALTNYDKVLAVEGLHEQKLREYYGEKMKEILDKYMQLHPVYFCKYGWLSHNWYNNFTKSLFVCILDMYRRKKLQVRDGRHISLDSSSTDFFDGYIIDMFRDSFRESNRNGHILYYDTEDILNALGSGNVIKIIKKYAVSISEYVNKDNHIKIDKQDISQVNKYIRKELKIKQVFLRDYFNAMSTDSCIDYMSIIVFIYNSNGLLYDKYGKGMKTNTTVDLLCKKCSVLENGVDWM